MSMKAMSLGLCVALAFLVVGCGRSKPASSKAPTTAEAAAEETVAPPPPDALPPKSTAAPAPPSTVAPPPPQPVSFQPLPPERDPAGAAESQKLSETRAKQAEAVKRELEQRAAQAQNEPEKHDGQ